VGRSIKRILQRRKQSPNKTWCWGKWRSRLRVLWRKAFGRRDPLGYGLSSSRRKGDGTQRRSTDLKQGRSRRQPRPGRRAKTCGITSGPGKAAGANETGGSGRSSEEERDNTTRSEPRTRGPGWSPRGGPRLGGLRNPPEGQEGQRATKALSNWGAVEVCRPGA
jgi:hypothetical protein